MAWPLDPLTAYVAGMSPAIKAFDLNAIQSAINSLYKGTASIKTLYVDGTGGNTVSQLPGLVVASALVTTTTVPTPTTYSPGTVAQGSVVRGWAVVNSNATLARGYNVYAVGRKPLGTSFGAYRVVFDTVPADPTNACVWVTLMEYVDLPCIYAVPSLVGGRLAVDVQVFSGSGPPLPVDARVSVGTFGE